MSGPHCLHLLVAHDALTEQHRYGTYITLCGALLGTSELPSSSCSDDCESEIVYCLGCIRAAAERNDDAGLDVDCPPGVIVRTERVSGVHLFAGDALAEGHRYPSGCVAVCGAVVRPRGDPGGDDDPTYCTACVDAAVRWSAEVDDRASGAADQMATR